MAKTRQNVGRMRSTVNPETRRIPKMRQKIRNPTDRTSRRERKSSDMSTDELSRQSDFLDVMPFNRSMFSDPFFSDIDDLFHFNPFNVSNTVNNMLNTFRNRAFDFGLDHHGLDPDRLNTPGTYHSKSQYRNTTHRRGAGDKGELITHEKTVHIDDRGKKFIEKSKTYEDLNGDTRKITQSRFIGDRGVKHMITHNLKTGEEYIHDEFKGMNEGQLKTFNDEFDRGVKNAKKYGTNLLHESSPRALGSDDWNKRFDWERKRIGT